jgi:hypothetical protein
VSGGSTGGQTPTGGGSGSTTSPTDSLPKLPDATAPSTDAPSIDVPVPVPELPKVSPQQDGGTLPTVEVPQTGVPAVDEATGDVTDGLQDALP